MGKDARAECVLDQIRFAAAAGVETVQVREPDLEARDLFALVQAGLSIVRGTGTKLVVNDRLDVALTAGADGVHLKAESIPAAVVRPAVPPGFQIGQSVHSVDEVTQLTGTVDYVIAGTIWPTESKRSSMQCIGADGLGRIVRASRMPVLAIGGVSMERIADVARSGAAGVAAIGLFMSPTNEAVCRAVPLENLVKKARQVFDTARSAS